MSEFSWGPKPAAIICLGLAGLLLGVACITLAPDPAGRFLSGVGAVGLLVFAAGSWRAQPRIAIGPDGLVLRGWLKTVILQRSDIAIVRITEFRRLGRKMRLLEIDSKDGQLVVLNRWDVGGDPINVLDALIDAGYAGRGRR
jgi:hypothetical protein